MQGRHGLTRGYRRVGIAPLAILALAWSCTPGENGEREILSGNEGFSERSYSVVTQEVEYAYDGQTVATHVARPEEEPRALVVVVHEWWGLNDWMRSVARRLAAEGYVAVVPDLYRGQVATDPEHAHELMRGLPEERAVADLRAALAHFRGEAGNPDLPAGIVGFCMGGRLSLLASLDSGPFDATVVCYGRPVVDPQRLETLPGSLLGIYGAEDRGIDVGQVREFEQALARAGKMNEVVIYPDAGHAFLNDTRDSYAPEAADRAWERIETFFEERLAAAAKRREGEEG